jgi:hypothetical protein
MTYASAGQAVVETIIVGGGYIAICCWIGNRLEEGERLLEESQERVKRIKSELEESRYLSRIISDYESSAFALDHHDNESESGDTGRAA